MPGQVCMKSQNPLHHGLMLAMIGFVLIGSLFLIFLVGNQSHAESLRVSLGVVTETPTVTNTPTATFSPTPTSTPSPTATNTPSPTSSPTQTFTPSPTPTPSWITERYLPLPLDEKWIEVDLSEQLLRAYEGETVRYVATVSTGRMHTPTIVGRFRIKTKHKAQLMRGPGYHLPNVPYVMYFYASYALHGAYWHDNWGTPTSHGCVNLKREDAKWLYDWAGPQVPEDADSVRAGYDNLGTWVLIHK